MFPKDKGQRKNKPTSVFRLFEFIFISTIVHPRKLTCPRNRDYFSREYILQPLVFRGYVSSQGSKSQWNHQLGYYFVWFFPSTEQANPRCSRNNNATHVPGEFICLQVMLRQAVKNSPTREGITPPSKRNHQNANMEGVGSVLFFFCWEILCWPYYYW